ncbi:hypothetical protein OROMI_005038 [Orobanche minor]
MKKLHYLNIANNHFEGPTPDNLSSRTNLNGINVHGNKLSGSVPLAFQNLESMTYLYLSYNYLRGPIPIELSLIETSRIIDSTIICRPLMATWNISPSSYNDLTGIIPADFGNLRSVMEKASCRTFSC